MAHSPKVVQMALRCTNDCHASRVSLRRNQLVYEYLQEDVSRLAHRHLQSLFIAAALIIGAISSNEAAAERVENYRTFFDIDLPEGYSVASESPEDDVIIYRFQNGSRVALTVYVGNTPHRTPASKGMSIFSVSPLSIISKWADDNLEQREWFIRLCDERWPRFLHASTGELITEGDRMAFSMRVKPTTVVCQKR